jgi:hypothetical protein
MSPAEWAMAGRLVRTASDARESVALRSSGYPLRVTGWGLLQRCVSSPPAAPEPHRAVRHPFSPRVQCGSPNRNTKRWQGDEELLALRGLIRANHLSVDHIDAKARPARAEP